KAYEPPSPPAPATPASEVGAAHPADTAAGWLPGFPRQSPVDIVGLVQDFILLAQPMFSSDRLARAQLKTIEILDALGFLPRGREGTVVNLLDGGHRAVGLDRNTIGVD